MRRLLPAAAIVFSLSLPLLAHPGIDVQIADLTERIAATPNDARLYLRRGELYRLHRDWKEAESDLRHARKLDPELNVVDQSLGRLMLDAERPKEALAPLERYLAKRPTDTRTLALLARTYMQLGRHLDAATAYSTTIASVSDGKPRPEYYLERARALKLAGPQHVEATLKGLDEGLRELDEPITLQLLAIEVEMLHKRYDGALSRIDRIIEGAARKESWFVRRGDILEKAGRFEAASAEYKKTLDAIAALPDARSRNRAVQRLQAEAEAGLSRVSQPVEN